MGDVPPETFKSRLLSSWPLMTNTSLPDQLAEDVTTVGYGDQQSKLAISQKNITTQHLMKAHVENDSKQNDQDIPPFYFPAPHVSELDVMFSSRSMATTYPAEGVSFQVVWPDPETELEGLQRVSIGIDDNNFPKIFLRRYVDFLDYLEGHKRRSEDQQSQKSKLKANDSSQCDEQ
ncbi:hypothetical protein KI688_004873 [Linnemannia hyalina]|uniref:Uncharacterized protein n=1 Tax=Linnemannia hyalina TaxID=64524 RepID=A0A9P8BPU4_9FUNG|nr:hypothetical protein KI688_004870 [Linnemannia hyalina]KAG9063269.1 hypothetical protein KI688_004873 [Linnemannia hyalina]